jgi:hypothetical protein
VNHSEASASEFRVAASLFFRGAFQQCDPRSLLGRGKRRTQSSVPSTHDYDIITISHSSDAFTFHIMEHNSIPDIRVERLRRIYVNTAVDSVGERHQPLVASRAYHMHD